MSVRRFPALFAFLLLAGTVFAACASGGAATAPAAPAPPGRDSTADDYVPQPAASAGSAGSAAGRVFAPQASGTPTDQPLIVYNGTLSVEVDDLRSAVDQANQFVVSVGGHVASSQSNAKGDYSYSSVTYRIPAEHWDEALAGLRAVGKRIVDENIQSEDVTGQVVDLNARIANLQSTEQALQGIMARASSIPDILNIQEELTSTQGDIESMTAQRDSLANRAALATLTVDFQLPPVAQTTVATGGWDLGHEVDNAVAALVRIGQGLTTLAVWILIVVVPIVVPLVILLFLAAWLRRRWLRAHPRPVTADRPAGAPPM